MPVSKGFSTLSFCVAVFGTSLAFLSFEVATQNVVSRTELTRRMPKASRPKQRVFPSGVRHRQNKHGAKVAPQLNRPMLLSRLSRSHLVQVKENFAMTTLVDHRSPSVTSASPARFKQSGRVVSSFQCLVVSTDEQRTAMLEQAAFDGGWTTVVGDDSEQAWMAIKRQRFQLVIVDLQDVSNPEELKSLAQEVSGSSNTLLMLCGNEGDGMEEIWARQLGAWLYLPGVCGASDVTSLCEQAIPVAEKLNGTVCQRVSC